MTSSIRPSKNGFDDAPLWNYVKVIGTARSGGGNRIWNCTFCKKRVTGSYSKVKGHLLKIPNHGVERCKVITDDAFRELKKEHEEAEERKNRRYAFGAKRKREYVSLPDSSESSDFVELKNRKECETTSLQFAEESAERTREMLNVDENIQSLSYPLSVKPLNQIPCRVDAFVEETEKQTFADTGTRKFARRLKKKEDPKIVHSIDVSASEETLLEKTNKMKDESSKPEPKSVHPGQALPDSSTKTAAMYAPSARDLLNIRKRRASGSIEMPAPSKTASLSDSPVASVENPKTALSTPTAETDSLKEKTIQLEFPADYCSFDKSGTPVSDFLPQLMFPAAKEHLLKFKASDVLLQTACLGFQHVQGSLVAREYMIGLESTIQKLQARDKILTAKEEKDAKRIAELNTTVNELKSLAELQEKTISLLEKEKAETSELIKKQKERIKALEAYGRKKKAEVLDCAGYYVWKTRAELMAEFKEGKSSNWNPDEDIADWENTFADMVPPGSVTDNFDLGKELDRGMDIELESFIEASNDEVEGLGENK